MEQLSKAPIREAILNIIVKLPPNITINDIEKIHDIVKDEYPIKKDFIESKATIGAQFFEASKNKIGFSFFSDNNLQVMQPRLNSFIFNRLSPYENWNAFSSEANRLWQIYKEVTNPEITKLSLRYINTLEIPAKCELFDYLTTFPTVPPEMSQNIIGFLTRLIVTEPSINCSANIIQLPEKTTDNTTTIILDIEVFTNPLYSISNGNLWDAFNILRDYKNKIFSASITQKLKEKYK
jgi:uncharacterized protein (TIGR04255 family)